MLTAYRHGARGGEAPGERTPSFLLFHVFIRERFRRGVQRVRFMRLPDQPDAFSVFSVRKWTVAPAATKRWIDVWLGHLV